MVRSSEGTWFSPDHRSSEEHLGSPRSFPSLIPGIYRAFRFWARVLTGLVESARSKVKLVLELSSTSSGETELFGMNSLFKKSENLARLYPRPGLFLWNWTDLWLFYLSYPFHRWCLVLKGQSVTLKTRRNRKNGWSWTILFWLGGGANLKLGRGKGNTSKIMGREREFSVVLALPQRHQHC